MLNKEINELLNNMDKLVDYAERKKKLSEAEILELKAIQFFSKIYILKIQKSIQDVDKITWNNCKKIKED
jgi:hypothetical protein